MRSRKYLSAASEPVGGTQTTPVIIQVNAQRRAISNNSSTWHYPLLGTILTLIFGL